MATTKKRAAAAKAPAKKAPAGRQAAAAKPAKKTAPAKPAPKGLPIILTLVELFRMNLWEASLSQLWALVKAPTRL